MGTVFTLPEWDALWEQRETGSGAGSVRFLNMVGSADDLRTLSARNFVAPLDGGALTNPGVQADTVGPGEPYRRWRQGGGDVEWDPGLNAVPPPLPPARK